MAKPALGVLFPFKCIILLAILVAADPGHSAPQSERHEIRAKIIDERVNKGQPTAIIIASAPRPGHSAPQDEKHKITVKLIGINWAEEDSVSYTVALQCEESGKSLLDGEGSSVGYCGKNGAECHFSVMRKDGQQQQVHLCPKRVYFLDVRQRVTISKENGFLTAKIHHLLHVKQSLADGGHVNVVLPAEYMSALTEDNNGKDVRKSPKQQPGAKKGKCGGFFNFLQKCF